jgi:hypothetical protein
LAEECPFTGLCFAGDSLEFKGHFTAYHKAEQSLLVALCFVGDGLEFKVGGDGAIAGAKKSLPPGTVRK